MTTLAEKIAVMQAFERGEKIERFSTGLNKWVSDESPNWSWLDWDYRIAPKPKKTVELYQWLCKDRSGYYIVGHSEIPINCAIRRLDETRMVVEVEK